MLVSVPRKWQEDARALAAKKVSFLSCTPAPMHLEERWGSTSFSGQFRRICINSGRLYAFQPASTKVGLAGSGTNLGQALARLRLCFPRGGETGTCISYFDERSRVAESYAEGMKKKLVLQSSVETTVKASAPVGRVRNPRFALP